MGDIQFGIQRGQCLRLWATSRFCLSPRVARVARVAKVAGLSALRLCQRKRPRNLDAMQPYRTPTSSVQPRSVNVALHMIGCQPQRTSDASLAEE